MQFDTVRASVPLPVTWRLVQPTTGLDSFGLHFWIGGSNSRFPKILA